MTHLEISNYISGTEEYKGLSFEGQQQAVGTTDAMRSLLEAREHHLRLQSFTDKANVVRAVIICLNGLVNQNEADKKAAKD